MAVSKIQIVGITGSGKTELSKIISEKFGLKHIQIDDLLYIKKYSKKRDKKNFEKKLLKILKEKKIILDGTSLNFNLKFYKEFDEIILLKTKYFIKFIFYY